MNKELRRVSTVVLLMFVALFASSSIIQVFAVDELNADGRNVRTLYDSYSAERGALLVDGVPIAESIPVDDQYKFQRVYSNPLLYANVTGYFTLNQANPGLEGAMNDYLSGTSDEQFLDNLTNTVTGQNPKGASVELTLDPVVQQAAFDALGDQVGSVVAIRPDTGEVIAMVSKPTFDPNALAVHDSDQFYAAYNGLTADANSPLTNRAISGDLYHPGSVFKVIMASAAIDSGQFTADSSFPNPASLTLPNSSSVISNSSGGPCGSGSEASIATALRLSCNIPMAELGQALGADTIADYAARFGFGDDLEIPLNVTPSTYPDDIDNDVARLMLSSFGQDDVRITPLQIAMVSAAIANGGELMKPNLVESVLAPDLSEIVSFQPEVYGTPISADTATKMTQLMTDGVSNGAASNARISGVEVAGKTGTAENGVGDPYTLWFTGFAPADDPQVAVAVVVENGGGLGQTGFGNSVAAPIAKKVLEAVLNK
ncbi:cell elongation-specific peptidoglycan D,D-transpeptidase [Glaciihabitans tibetensis]|uniref:Cell elongation-specific peptidoglycan D,D-transpeptidase n=1 Tax=Glaciihabitans tibetensis TaxID=1266600 RepID=A0A2T0VCQ5_9MICO|nr:penicillin-binding protein 2 [Glaciihabitans tibetensis]PRY67949.1 cell elongation-specific peptidoglycan D,D-transpeptidase [Glaciihabitans tibetensis]